jgi:hypothetical protein
MVVFVAILAIGGALILSYACCYAFCDSPRVREALHDPLDDQAQREIAYYERKYSLPSEHSRPWEGDD